MLWLILILILVFIWAFINIYDKHIVSDELKDPFLCTVVYGITTFILFSAVVLITKQKIILPLNITLFATLGGISLGMAVFFYYKSLSHEEVSRVMPSLEFVPLFTLILATIFLHEFFTPIRYAGIILLIAGGFLISIKTHKKRKKKFYLTPVIITVLIAAIFFATRNILIRYSTFYASSLQLIFWIGFGSFLVALILLIFHHPSITKKIQIKGFKHLIIINALSAITLIPYVYVIKIAPAVSFISAIGAVQSLLVFIMATILSKSKKIVNESLEKKIIIQKIIAILIIIVGVILIAI